MAIEEEFSIEIPDKDADSIHSGTFYISHAQKLLLTPSQSTRLLSTF
jgi:hypothetical protein